jgi:dephospho-CoA kinase
MTLPKILVIGHGRHGKDTMCEILKDSYGFKFQSSSEFCARKFIYNELKSKYGYTNYNECYIDRHNHRTEWFNMIHDYCKDDLSRLGRDIFAENDIYCGLRNRSEFDAMRKTGVFDYAIWVDRSDHLPLEPVSSMNLEAWMADYVIDNNGSLDDLKKYTCRLAEFIIRQP